HRGELLHRGWRKPAGRESTGNRRQPRTRLVNLHSGRGEVGNEARTEKGSHGRSGHRQRRAAVSELRAQSFTRPHPPTLNFIVDTPRKLAHNQASLNSIVLWRRQ